MGIAKRKLLLLFVVATNACGVASVPAAARNAVVAVTDDTVNSTVGNHEVSVLLDVYAPWCGHCMELEPEFAAAASDLSDAGLPVVLAKVDATENSKTADWLEVKGYPTLVWFSKGSREAYSGERTRRSIVLWVKKRLGPPAEPLDTLQALETAKRGSEVFLLGFFLKQEGAEWLAFEGAARELQNLPVYVTNSPEVAAELGLVEAPGFAVGTTFVANGGFKAVPWSGHPAFERPGSLQQQLASFVTAEELPPFQPYTSAASAQIFSLDRQVFLLGPIEQLQPGGEALNAVLRVHPQFKGRIAFASAALRTDPADMLLDFFGLDRSIRDAVQVIGFHPDEKKYLLREELTPENLAAFCQGVWDGTYPRYYKSQPPPARPVESHVTLVVGSTFDAIVLDPSKDVLLMVYAAWSDKSKHLAVVWKKLGRHFRSSSSVVIAKFDGGANEHPSVPGTAFPSVWLFPARKTSEGIKYSGEPSSRELLRFLKRHAAKPISTQAPTNAPKEEL